MEEVHCQPDDSGGFGQVDGEGTGRAGNLEAGGRNAGVRRMEQVMAA